jgi:hypothetical protein
MRRGVSPASDWGRASPPKRSSAIHASSLDTIEIEPKVVELAFISGTEPQRL